MAITPDFLDEIRARIRVSDVVGRRVKLTRRGREFVGLSPFNNEKTPSFTVNDQKAFYHCFSSGKHGDVFSFLQEVEGLSFPEAVERLAEEAGLEVPRQSARSKQAAEAQRSLLDVVELAAQYFEQALQGTQGEEARRYLQTRKLLPKTWKTFRLGYAPDNRTGLIGFLTSKDVSRELMEQAGLLSKRDDGDFQDKFRNRIMFPIADVRGRIIAFGGRALEKDSHRPKYLNSPETPLFHKGRVLYNHHSARSAAHESQSVLLAEGYMDVIALAQGGFQNAVAPLGTALTADQLSLLWRMAPEPILCFDGDRAGLKAAHRAIDLALPLLKPGHSLRFALLPGGQDPDDIINTGGAASFQNILDQALPLVDTLWDREIGAKDISTPEARAGFEKRVSDLLSSISENRVRDHYRREFTRRWQELFPSTRPSSSSAERRQRPAPWRKERGPRSRAVRYQESDAPLPSSALLQSSLAKPTGANSVFANHSQKGGQKHSGMRETVLVLTVINHPELLDTVGEEFASLELQSAELDRIRQQILEIAVSSSGVDRDGLVTHFNDLGIGKIKERFLGKNVLGSFRFVNAECPTEDALKGWQQAYSIHDKIGRLQAQHDEIVVELAEEPTEELFERWQILRNELELLHSDSFEEDAL